MNTSQSSAARADSAEVTRVFVSIVAAAIVALAMTLVHLGAADVCSGNEAVEGVFVQQMVEHGEYLFPRENGTVPMYKPPLFHWTATAIDRIAALDKVTAFNLRLPSVLYAVLGVVLTMVFAYDVMDFEAAVLAGLTLLASYQYISQGRYGRVDMALCFFEALSLFFFSWWHRPVSARGARASGGIDAMQYLLAIALGLAVLAKGPVGALLPLAAMIVFVGWEGQGYATIRRISPSAVLLFLLIASSWYLACYLGGRYGFLDRQLGSENVGRFFGALGAMKAWYYVFPLLLNSPPFSFLVPIAVILALRSKRSEAPVAGGRGAQAARLMAIFWIVTVGFFSIAAYKRRAYLLPLWPPSAVMLAWMVETFARRTRRRMVEGAYAAVCIAALIANFVIIPQREVRECGGDSFRPAAAEIRRVVTPDQPLYTYGFTEELAPLLFYLDRDALPIGGKLETRLPAS